MSQRKKIIDVKQADCAHCGRPFEIVKYRCPMGQPGHDHYVCDICYEVMTAHAPPEPR